MSQRGYRRKSGKTKESRAAMAERIAKLSVQVAQLEGRVALGKKVAEEIADSNRFMSTVVLWAIEEHLPEMCELLEGDEEKILGFAQSIRDVYKQESDEEE